MNWSDIPFTPSTRTLRQFAGLWILFFAGLTYWQNFMLGKDALALFFAALAIVIGLVGLARPQIIRPIFVVWMIAAFPVGWIMSRVLLSFLYYGVFMPVGLCFRLVGRDVLNRRYNPGKDSYWTRKNYATDLVSYFRQY